MEGKPTHRAQCPSPVATTATVWRFVQVDREFSARVRESWRAGVVGSFFRRQGRREAFKYLWPEFPHSQHPQILLSQPRGLFAFGNARIAREHCHPRGKTDSVAISLISNDLRIAWNWQPTCELQRRCGAVLTGKRGRQPRSAVFSVLPCRAAGRSWSNVAGVTTNAGPRTHPPAR
jgi:hypothetical protein